MAAGALEELVATRPCGVFKRAPLAPRTFADVASFDKDRQRQRRREFSAELLRVCRGRSQLLLEVCQSHELQVTGAVKLAQQVRCRDRVGSARYRPDHARGRLREAETPDRAAQAIDELHVADGNGSSLHPPEKVVPEDGLEPSTPRL